ncbi:MAG: winged helix-turn-helix domain-containing protein [Betaproteobacteria bacterium]|nr:winged helix-turn-helix domain-containing protein [Betaproteobacteria bacterium]
MDALYRFGRFELRPATRQLLADGQPVALGARAFDVLVALIERRERLVTKDELLDLVWPGLVVEENNLQVQVSTLRKVLGVHAISTIPARGYQFTLRLDSDAGLLPLGRTDTGQAATEPELALPDKPSIAVLPFANFGGDPEAEYFVDGITEDIITELSRFRSLFVIARNSTFSYKGRSADVRQVGKELGVRYVLEGSIRKMANRIRVTGQLVDAPSGKHIWAERYDRTLEDVFALLEEVTQSIVTAIAPQIEASEREKARRRRPGSLTAYEIAVRANTHVWEAVIKSDRGLRDQACQEAKEALGIDPRSTRALNVLAFAQYLNVSYRTVNGLDAAWQDGMAAATMAIEQDSSDSEGYLRKGLLLTVAPEEDRCGEALTNLRTAHELNPNDVNVLTVLGWCEAIVGNAAPGIEYLHQALRSAPRQPLRYTARTNLAIAYSLAKDFSQTVKYALLAANEAPSFALAHLMLAIGYVGLGDIENAGGALKNARSLAPEYVESRLNGTVPYRNLRDRQQFTTFLRIAAGLEDPSAADTFR